MFLFLLFPPRPALPCLVQCPLGSYLAGKSSQLHLLLIYMSGWVPCECLAFILVFISSIRRCSGRDIYLGSLRILLPYATNRPKCDWLVLYIYCHYLCTLRIKSNRYTTSTGVSKNEAFSDITTDTAFILGVPWERINYVFTLNDSPGIFTASPGRYSNLSFSQLNLRLAPVRDSPAVDSSSTTATATR